MTFKVKEARLGGYDLAVCTLGSAGHKIMELEKQFWSDFKFGRLWLWAEEYI